MRSVLFRIYLIFSFQLIPPLMSMVYADEGQIGAVVIAKDRGGYGDLSANLTMVEKLIESSEVGQIILILGVFDSEEPSMYAQVKQKIAYLWPEYDPQNPLPQNLFEGRVKVYDYKNTDLENLPQTDWTTSFSNQASGWSKIRIFSNRKTQAFLNYLEFHEIFVDRTSSGLTNTDIHPPMVSLRDPPTAEFNTGAGLGGLYISAERPSPPLDKKDLLNLLGSFSETDISENSELAVASAHNPGAIERYYGALARYARQFPDRNFLLISRPLEGLSFSDIPSNLRVVSAQIPKLVFESAIAHSNLPPLVTGDLSMSHAVDYEQPFFYQASAWKLGSAQAVYKEVLRNSPTDDISYKKALSRSLLIDASGQNTSEDFFLETFSNTTFLTNFELALTKLRKTNSLVSTFLADIWLLRELSKNPKRHTPEVSDYILTLRTHAHRVGAYQKFDRLREEVLNEELPVEERVALLQAILFIGFSETKGNQLMVNDLLRANEDIGYLQITQSLVQNLDRLAIRYYITRALRSDDSQVVAGAKFLLETTLAQDKSQWSTGRKEAEIIHSLYEDRCLEILETGKVER